MTDQDGRIRSYVLRGGRVSRAQKRSYDSLKDALCIPFSEENLNFKTIFNNDNPVIVEIGFGMGIATAEIAEENPQKNYLGLEVFRAGVGRLLWEIENRNLSNIRIVEYDAVGVVEKMIPEHSVAAFHIFFPDPWPKKKHHKRRLVKRPFTGLLAGKLTEGGYIYMVTDWPEYGEEALADLNATEGVQNANNGFAPRQSWRPKTKFETKALSKGRAPLELLFYAAKHSP